MSMAFGGLVGPLATRYMPYTPYLVTGSSFSCRYLTLFANLFTIILFFLGIIDFRPFRSGLRLVLVHFGCQEDVDVFLHGYHRSSEAREVLGFVFCGKSSAESG